VDRDSVEIARREEFTDEEWRELCREHRVEPERDQIALSRGNATPAGEGTAVEARGQRPRRGVPKRGPSALDSTRIRESQNTQSPGLGFRALLTEGGDPRVQLHRV
jgi:hypothetical protein